MQYKLLAKLLTYKQFNKPIEISWHLCMGKQQWFRTPNVPSVISTHREKPTISSCIARTVVMRQQKLWRKNRMGTLYAIHAEMRGLLLTICATLLFKLPLTWNNLSNKSVLTMAMKLREILILQQWRSSARRSSPNWSLEKNLLSTWKKQDAKLPFWKITMTP